MRDLANQDYSNTSIPSKTSNSRSKIIISRSSIKIIIALAAVLIILFIAKNITSSGSLIGSSQLVLRDAPKGMTPVVENERGNLVDDAVNLVIENATFTNVSEQAGSATATRKYGDGSFTMTVNASLPSTSDDGFGDDYQVWIVGDNVLKLAGTLKGFPGSMLLVFNDVDNYSNTNQIWITRERTNFEGRPEQHILEGIF